MTREILYGQYLETPIFAFDIETDTNHYHWKSSLKRGLSYVTDITHISFYAEGLEPLVLTATPVETPYVYQEFNRDILQFEGREGEQLRWHFTTEEDAFIRAMFSRENYTAIAHNLVFDARQIFGKFNLVPPDSATFWDTLSVHVFGAWGQDFEESEDAEENTEKVRDSFTLYNLTHQWLDEETQEWWKGFKGERGNLTKLITDEKKRTKLGLTLEDLDRYVAIDSIMAYKLYQWQQQEIEQNGFEAQYDEARKIQTDSMDTLLRTELDYTKLCVTMAARGVRANVEYLHHEMVKYTALWKENLERLGLTAETEHLSRSRTWQQEYIFGIIGAPPQDPQIQQDNRLKTKTDSWSFNKDALKFYMESYPDLIYFRYHMDIETKIGQIENFLRHSEYDGRIHFILSRLTVTGRNAGSSPNTQNLQMSQKNRYPKGTAVEIPAGDAGYLIADEGKQLLSLDCSNAENWIGSMYGMDDAMALACAAEDFHEAMASTAYFLEQWKEADAEERARLRKIGKTITFGTSYGMGQKKLARSINVTQDEARAFLENKDRRFWRIAEAKRRSAAFAEQNGYTMLWTGRRVRIRKWQGKYKGYTAWNSQAQGGVGEMIVRGMLRVAEYLKGFHSRIVTQVHDEIVLEIDIGEYHEIIVHIIELLSTVIPDLWNSRTVPKCRWLFTLDNIENSHKWGYNPYEAYRLPLGHYVNRWGFHEYPPEVREAPTWINSFGWGDLALSKELGHIEELPEILVEKPFDWLKLRDSMNESLTWLTNPVEVNQHFFPFPENLKVLRELHHKQGDPAYEHVLKALDGLSEVLENYKEWRLK